MSTEERITRLEDAFTQLHTMTRNLDERMDDHMGWINQLGSRMEELAAAQANSEHKIAAMTDAIFRLDEAQRRTDTNLDALAAAQLRTEDVMSRLAAQMTEIAAAQGRTDANVSTLASKVDALADLVRAKS